MHNIDLIISEHEPRVELVLVERDVSDALILPQKLHSCENQCNKLVELYDKIVSSSSFELVLV